MGRQQHFPSQQQAWLAGGDQPSRCKHSCCVGVLRRKADAADADSRAVGLVLAAVAKLLAEVVTGKRPPQEGWQTAQEVVARSCLKA